MVEFADSGPGIAPADQGAIFIEFHRLPAARAARTPGTGLGLAIARRVALAHGGRLSLESRPGQGSTFRLSFLLPRRAGLGLESRTDRTAALQADQRPMSELRPIRRRPSPGQNRGSTRQGRQIARPAPDLGPPGKLRNRRLARMAQLVRAGDS